MKIINYDNRLDEIKMDNIIFNGTDTTDFYHVHWMLLDGCNYNCSYCFGHEKLTKDFTPIEKLKHAVDEILKLNKKKYLFEIVGGEVTYHPNLIELIEYIYSCSNEEHETAVHLITNGSRDVKYFEKLLSIVNTNHFACLMSVHFEYASLDHIKDLIKLFNNYGAMISFSIMLNYEYKDQIFYYFDELIKLKKQFHFEITLAPILEPPDFIKLDRRYDNDFFNWIDKSNELNKNTLPSKVFSINLFLPFIYYTIEKNAKKENISISYNLALRNNLLNYKNFYCCTGSNTIEIHSNGNYKGAICSVAPYIGNIYEENINIDTLTVPTKCTTELCFCFINTSSNKYRNKEDAEAYINKVKFEYYYKCVKEDSKDQSIISLNKSDAIINKLDSIESKINKLINSIAWWIPIKKYRDNFKNKF
ncbi:radical SAM protein [Brachyspira intermedia]|uniref:radical SAM protein n=1 Tax=Brachyspira intermedia TaxID=84377 RepID=UPI0030057D9A